jgi:hypothetical protein
MYEVYHTILDDFVPRIRLVDTDHETKQTRISDGYIASACVNWDDMIQLLHQCLVMNLKSRVIQAMDGSFSSLMLSWSILCSGYSLKLRIASSISSQNTKRR